MNESMKLANPDFINSSNTYDRSPVPGHMEGIKMWGPSLGPQGMFHLKSDFNCFLLAFQSPEHIVPSTDI